jgi:hypothetical protein
MTKIGFAVTFFFLPIMRIQYLSIRSHFQKENHFFQNPGKGIPSPYSTQNFIKTDTLPKSSSMEVGKKDDAFSRLMAGVVNDTAILFNTYIDEIPKKDSAKNAIAKKPEEKISNQSMIIPGNKIQEDSPMKRAVVTKKIEKGRGRMEKPNQTAIIQKLSEYKNDSSLQMVFTDISKNGKKDTIVIVIPFETAIMIPKQQNDSLKKAPDPAGPAKDTVQDSAKSMSRISIKPAEKNIKSSSNSPPAENNTRKDSATRENKSPSAIPVSNPNCKNMATDYDVDKLRVKMLAIENDDDKVQLARKFFKIKCFRTIQIRALSEVFPTDEGRYKFLDAAYSFVYDFGNYPQLAGLLTGQYYLNRFKAMIRQ